MAKKRRYLTKKVLSYTSYGGVRGALNLLMEANIKDVGKKTIRQDKEGNRYVTINRKRYYFKKSHPIYNYDLYSEYKKIWQ